MLKCQLQAFVCPMGTCFQWKGYLMIQINEDTFFIAWDVKE